jgi:transposase
MAWTRRVPTRARKDTTIITVLTDLKGSRVLDVAPERTQAAAEAVLQTLSTEQRQAVRAAAADMLPAYANAVAAELPNAELVHDKFHVTKLLNEAVDKVRRAENKALLAMDDDRLKGTKQLWLFSKPNLSRRQHRIFDAIKNAACKRPGLGRSRNSSGGSGVTSTAPRQRTFSTAGTPGQCAAVSVPSSKWPRRSNAI